MDFLQSIGGKDMIYLYLAIFAVSSIVHLYASYKSNKKLRAQTKPFILLGLLGWYCCAASPVQTIVIAALITSWLGDVLLIPKGVKWFTIGGVSFLASHLCFVFAYMPNVSFDVIPTWALIAAAVAYFAAACLVFKGLRDSLPKMLFVPMFIYLLVNGTMNCFALYQLISLPCTATAVTFAGAMLFFASDSALFYTRFKKDSIFKNHFFVMLTYILAEFLIVWGLILIH